MKNCSKCNASFTCKANDIENCHCSKILIPEETKDILNSSYSDCLCAACLYEIVFKNEINSNPKNE